MPQQRDRDGEDKDIIDKHIQAAMDRSFLSVISEIRYNEVRYNHGINMKFDFCAPGVNTYLVYKFHSNWSIFTFFRKTTFFVCMFVRVFLRNY